MTLYTQIDSSLGKLLLTSRDGRLTGLYFADQPHAKIAPEWTRRDEAEVFARTARQLSEFSLGKREHFDLPMYLDGTPFQEQVWHAITKIPFGKTISYTELAEQIGAPEAVRAVGGAAGRNPIGWVVPCHRVMGKSGALTGYAGRVTRKSVLLDFEATRAAGREAVLKFSEKQPTLTLT
jgi:methylated-DNA-[protein]-cysteine S-methyltransferase